MTYFSYHTHSSFCDGLLDPESYIKEAVKIGMSAVGFSSHAPLNDQVVWAMKDFKLEEYLSEISRLKQKYCHKINIYLSLELDYIPGYTKSFEYWRKTAGLDYTIGSVHLVASDFSGDYWFLDGPSTNYSEGLQTLFGGDIKKAVSAYYHQVIEMIETQSPDVVGHVDKVKMNNKDNYFLEHEPWYVELLDKTLEAIEKSGSIVEVNTRGLYKMKSKKHFPDDYFLDECKKRNIPITISTDAHHPSELIKHFDQTRIYLKQKGFERFSVFHNGFWIEERI